MEGGQDMRRWLGASRSAKRLLLAIGLGVAALGVTGLSSGTLARASTHSGEAKLHPFTITSPNFRDGRPLPVSAESNAPAFGCNGQNQAPTLRWTNVPAGTNGFAFTMNDVDAARAGGFHHWVVYNIPASVHELVGHGQNPFTEGTNSVGTTGYFGPCPPANGQVHHYIFTVYALSVAQVAGDHNTFEQLLQAIAPNVVGATSTIGTFRLPLDD
jgi:Raf kinase inhibitor-like YbhB/YbcL family protein